MEEDKSGTKGELSGRQLPFLIITTMPFRVTSDNKTPLDSGTANHVGLEMVLGQDACAAPFIVLGHVAAVDGEEVTPDNPGREEGRKEGYETCVKHNGQNGNLSNKMLCALNALVELDKQLIFVHPVEVERPPLGCLFIQRALELSARQKLLQPVGAAHISSRKNAESFIWTK